MADKTNEKCAHPSCTCVAAKDSKYCSTFCEGSEGRVDIICNCGHSACAEVATAASGERARY